MGGHCAGRAAGQNACCDMPSIGLEKYLGPAPSSCSFLLRRIPGCRPGNQLESSRPLRPTSPPTWGPVAWRAQRVPQPPPARPPPSSLPPALAAPLQRSAGGGPNQSGLRRGVNTRHQGTESLLVLPRYCTGTTWALMGTALRLKLTRVAGVLAHHPLHQAPRRLGLALLEQQRRFAQPVARQAGREVGGGTEVIQGAVVPEAGAAEGGAAHNSECRPDVARAES